jgi:hypothetical protein
LTESRFRIGDLIKRRPLPPKRRLWEIGSGRKTRTQKRKNYVRMMKLKED